MSDSPISTYNSSTIITAIDNAIRFPEVLTVSSQKYNNEISTFKVQVAEATSSADLLAKIRSRTFNADQRMAFLKIFRRAVSPVLDTEMAKKVSVPTEILVSGIGDTFKPIALLKQQFATMSPYEDAALAALIGEYDTRGQLGYILTEKFFYWFENRFQGEFSIEGPRGAGRDVELSSIYNGYIGNFPCDFVIRSLYDNVVRAIGFARYDSTRGGAQSDDRTGGNSDKVNKAREFCMESGNNFKLIFLSDGPGMAHRDTWHEACSLDQSWGDNVRVTTLKTATERVSYDWLMSTTGGVVAIP